MGKGLGEHGNRIDKSDDWYTPKHVFDALGVRFDLDVAAPAEGPRYVPTSCWLSSDGLEQDWRGFVWMNPPFGHERAKIAWLGKFIEHGNGVALLPDRTSAFWWQWAAPQMDLILFVAPKIKFERPDGSIGEQPGTGTTLFALGEQAVEALRRAHGHGLGITFNTAPSPLQRYRPRKKAEASTEGHRHACETCLPAHRHRLSDAADASLTGRLSNLADATHKNPPSCGEDA
jgi:hypothetical protein